MGFSFHVTGGCWRPQGCTLPAATHQSEKGDSKMRYLMASFVFLAVGLLALPARADDDDKDAKKADDGPRAEWREKMIKEFDKDGDGKLSDEEREKAREKMRELRGDRGRGGPGGPEGRRGDGPRGPEGRRGPDGRRPEGGPDGPPKLPKPEELFAKFDKDKDDKLSKDEFKALADFVHEHMPPPPPGPPGPPPGGRRFEGRIEGRIFDGPEGPGPGFRGEGRGPRFLGPDGPPPEGEGRDRGEFRRGPRPDGPPPGDGPGARGRRLDRGERRGPPPGDRDDDGDDDHHKKGDKDDDHQEKAEKDKTESAV